MTQKIAEEFINALRHLESTSDADPIAALFDADCEVGNVIASEDFHGPERARDFWRRYQDNFGEVRSDFRNRIVTDNRIALEWISEGKSKTGKDVKYEGVSILETDGDKITRFYAYFDSGKLGHQIVEHGHVR